MLVSMKILPSLSIVVATTASKDYALATLSLQGCLVNPGLLRSIFNYYAFEN